MSDNDDNERSWIPDVFDYLNFREYMRDYYLAAKENIAAMSFRYLSRKAGFGSPNFYKLVMDGDRNLSSDGAERVANAIGLRNDERDFFLALVEFNLAETHAEKNAAFQQVSASRRFRQAGRIEPDLFEYLSHWYYPACREMTARVDFKPDPEWIAQNLFPPVRPAEVRRALEVLLRLGLLTESNGTYQRGEPTLTTGHEVNSLAIVNYHHQMIELGRDSIEAVDREHRDISAITMCINPDQVAEIKSRIHAFRETLIELAESTDEPTAVYQLNVQLFPINQTES